MRFIWIVGIFLLGCEPPPITEGSFTALTYNVAGLPDGISSSDPEKNIPLIGPRLNKFDLVLVQEDFSYQQDLRKDISLEYQTEPKITDAPIGDGLNIFSKFALGDVKRIQWDGCYGLIGDGSDCLAEKGFMYATIELTEGVFLDVYNCHMDGGDTEEDDEERLAQVRQMRAFIDKQSKGKSVLVGGDSNLRFNRESQAPILEDELFKDDFMDACLQLDCEDADVGKRIDRFWYRVADGVRLKPTIWKVPSDEFLDSDGEKLSDHQPIQVNWRWAR